jgi:hypothetical protein
MVGLKGYRQVLHPPRLGSIVTCSGWTHLCKLVSLSWTQRFHPPSVPSKHTDVTLNFAFPHFLMETDLQQLAAKFLEKVALSAMDAMYRIS